MKRDLITAADRLAPHAEDKLSRAIRYLKTESKRGYCLDARVPRLPPQSRPPTLLDRWLARKIGMTPTLTFDRGSVRNERGELVGNITDCSVAFARELLIRYSAHDELVTALRCAEPWLKFAQECVDNDDPSAGELARVLADARAALAKVEG